MDDAAQLANLRREVKQLRAVVVAMLLAGAAVLAIGASSGPSVLRAKGLVIIDDQGRERILLGSPTPASAMRNRKGADTSSIVFLGEDGADRVIVGQSPQPLIQGHAGVRIAQAWGLVIHDPHGNERGGIAYLGSGRAAVMLDYPSHDAIGMVVDDKSSSARLLLAYPSSAKAPNPAAELEADVNGASLLLHDQTGRVSGTLPQLAHKVPAATR